jgi:hypothetical protein
MSEEKIAVEKRLVEADEEEEIGEDEEDGKTNEIEDQIEEMNLLPPPPAPVQDVAINTFTEPADITIAATSTTSPSFLTFSAPQLSFLLTSTIKNIPHSISSNQSRE